MEQCAEDERILIKHGVSTGPNPTVFAYLLNPSTYFGKIQCYYYTRIVDYVQICLILMVTLCNGLIELLRNELTP